MAETTDQTVDAHRFAPAAPDEQYVYGACCPGWHRTATREEAVDEWVSFMRERGVERVCCLLTGGQLDRYDANIAKYRDEFGTDRVLHAPIPDHHLADADTMREDVLPFLDAAVERREPVVVHCLAGIGRTGQVLAAWLVHAHDDDPVDAIETVQEMGRSPAEAVEAGNARQGELHALLTEFE